MRPRPALETVLLLAASLAGCLDGAETSVPLPTGSAEASVLRPFVNPIVLDHDHNDLGEHQLSNNVALVGREPGILPGGVGEIDTAGDLAYVALLGFGFAIVDLKDPANPKVLSRTQAASPDPIKYVADLKVDRTGNWVFLGMELSSTPGVLIYDATNKAAPRLAGFWAAPGKLAGCHMVEYAVIGDSEYLFCAPLDAAIYIGMLTPPGPAREVVHVARWAPAHLPFLQKESRDAVRLAQNLAGSGHDDMTYLLDPLTTRPTIIISFWDLGVWFVDVTLPANPTTLGYWNGENAKFWDGAIHTAMSFKVGDRRIVAAIPEGARPPTLFVLDATNYASPKLLSEWKALEDFKNKEGQDQSGRYSMHNFQVVEGKVYLAMYHGGIWVIDVSSEENLAAPMPVGSYAPHEPRADGRPYAVGAWDVVVWKGYMLTGDSNGGFYVLHHTGDPAGDAGHMSFA